MAQPPYPVNIPITTLNSYTYLLHHLFKWYHKSDEKYELEFIMFSEILKTQIKYFHKTGSLDGSTENWYIWEMMY